MIRETLTDATVLLLFTVLSARVIHVPKNMFAGIPWGNGTPDPHQGCGSGSHILKQEHAENSLNTGVCNEQRSYPPHMFETITCANHAREKKSLDSAERESREFARQLSETWLGQGASNSNSMVTMGLDYLNCAHDSRANASSAALSGPGIDVIKNLELLIRKMTAFKDDG